MTNSPRTWSRLIYILAAMLFFGAGCSHLDEQSDPETGPQSSIASAEVVGTINPEADRILKSACDTLTAARFYSFKAEIWEDQVVSPSHKVSTTKTMAVQVRRPNGLRAEIKSAKRDRVLFYDGRNFTQFDRDKNLYGTVSAPDTIEKTLDAAHDTYGIVIPLDDLVVEDPYASAKRGFISGAYFGKASVLGVPCQHIVFSTPSVDWQLWVQDGANTVRKIVITYRNEDSAPQYTAIFSDWNLSSSIPDTAFSFSPPAGAGKVEILPAKTAAD